jgi:lipopolysaccharide transport system ATP-binding protein
MGAMIEVHDLGKRYRIGARERPADSFREVLVQGLRKPLDWWRRGRTGPEGADGRSDLWALRDVGFEVKQGEIVGVIGSNGAGKSTLLKILSRITDPTCGCVRVRGRLSSLLEVGTGFHPELTGRENIFLNGAILGMRKAEIVARFDEIVAFAEIEKFLDTPVKRYSSGMYVRLAFAVAAHLQPEILVVDEVLAVGDLGFQKKCLEKMSEFSRGGRTVLLVSHNMAAVQGLCSSGVVLQKGRLAYRGGVDEAIGFYFQSAAENRLNGGAFSVDVSGVPRRAPHLRHLLKRVEVMDGDGRHLVGGVPVGAPLRLRITYEVDKPMMVSDVVVGFDTLIGQRVLTVCTAYDPTVPPEVRAGEQVVNCEIPSLALMPGEYKVLVHIESVNTLMDVVDDAGHFSVLPTDYYGTGRLWPYGTFVTSQSWRYES